MTTAQMLIIGIPVLILILAFIYFGTRQPVGDGESLLFVLAFFCIIALVTIAASITVELNRLQKVEQAPRYEPVREQLYRLK